MLVSWCMANPEPDEREVLTALLERDHRLVRCGQVTLADRGFAGQEFEAFLRRTRRPGLVHRRRIDEAVPRAGQAQGAAVVCDVAGPPFASP